VFIRPSILVTLPAPTHVMQPRITILPSPNFRVDCSCELGNTFSSLIHADWIPSLPTRLIFVPSDRMIRFRSFLVRPMCFSTHLSLDCLCSAAGAGFLTRFLASNSDSLGILRIVSGLNLVPCSFAMTLAALTAVSTLLLAIKLVTPRL